MTNKPITADVWDPFPCRIPNTEEMSKMSTEEIKIYQTKVESAITYLQDHYGDAGVIIYHKIINEPQP
jgi:hypothetical protein